MKASKKIQLAAAITAAALTAMPLHIASAQTPTPYRSALRSAALSELKQKGEAAIDRRITLLTTLKGKINSARHLTDSDRSNLLSQIDAAISGLKALRVKIASDTDLATLRTDLRAIVIDYRVYLLVVPKVHLVVAADRILAVADKFEKLETKLQTAIDKAKSKGKDTAAAQAALDDMKSKVTAAISLASSVPPSVLPLTAPGYPANRPTLEQARDALKTARQDLRAARADAKTVVADLKAS